MCSFRHFAELFEDFQSPDLEIRGWSGFKAESSGIGLCLKPALSKANISWSCMSLEQSLLSWC